MKDDDSKARGCREALQIARRKLHSGYAFDLVCNFMDEAWPSPAMVGEDEDEDEGSASFMSAQDADSLFRALVLDEQWCTNAAWIVYVSAMEIVDAR